MYLLDTDTCIHLARGNSRVVEELRKKRRSDVLISIISVYEMEFGLRKATLRRKEKRRALDDLIELIGVAPFERAEAIEAAAICSELEKAGTPIGSIDYLIAGSARAHRCTLVTGNAKEFSRVKKLKLETWHR
jgi:tRNA(fMet)-specific endonuclease VapC